MVADLVSAPAFPLYQGKFSITAHAKPPNAATSRRQGQLYSTDALRTGFLALSRASSTLLPSQGAVTTFQCAAVWKKWGQLSRVPELVRGVVSSAQSLGIHLVPSSSPDQGSLHDIHCYYKIDTDPLLQHSQRQRHTWSSLAPWPETSSWPQVTGYSQYHIPLYPHISNSSLHQCSDCSISLSLPSVHYIPVVDCSGECAGGSCLPMLCGTAAEQYFL